MAYASVLIVCVAFPRAAASQDAPYFAPSNILRFADALFEEKDYLRAAAEYERYLSVGVHSDSEAASARFKIGLCFRLVQDFARATEAFRVVATRFPDTDVASDAQIQMAYSLFLSGRYDDSARSISDSMVRVRTEEHRSTLLHLQGVNFLFQRRLKAADDVFRSLEATAARTPVTDALARIARDGLQMRRKKPYVAGLLSTFLPGTGRIYAGRKGDGLLSMVTIAATSWQAYGGFERNGRRSVRGWIYGSLAAFLYVGNVYGSVVAVRISNEEAENKLLVRARTSIDVVIR
jgi:hypothetical protein